MVRLHARSVDDLLTIGEFSERSGLSQKRLRSYAAAGLLVPAAVDSDTGYRYYGPGQLRDARTIDALRRADVPLSEIARALRDPTTFDFEGWQHQLESRSTARRAALDEAIGLLAVGSAHRPHREASEMTTITTMTVATRSEIGPVRATNQDAVIVGERLVGVADGMGGAPGGDVASSLAAAVVEAGFEGSAAVELPAVTRSANAAIFARAVADRSLVGMGTTLCCAGLIADGTLIVVNVGDSRAYLVRDGHLRQITDDHTVTADLIRTGQLEEAAAADHPLRHVLTRVLGVGPTVEADTVAIDVEDGDLLLLCTDGLWKEVEEAELADLMAADGTPAEIADGLVTRALERGAHDNVTVAIARYQTSRPHGR